MALVLDMGSDNISVISRRDASVNCTIDEYNAYLKDLDESRLNLIADVEPTRFVMRKVLPYAAVQKIKNEQVSFKADVGAQNVNDVNVNMKMGYVLEELRAALVDVKNPGMPQLHFRKDGDGLAAKELISLLNAYGIADELHAAFQSAIENSVSKKK
jgi:hypothetical protein